MLLHRDPVPRERVEAPASDECERPRVSAVLGLHTAQTARTTIGKVPANYTGKFPQIFTCGGWIDRQTNSSYSAEYKLADF